MAPNPLLVTHGSSTTTSTAGLPTSEIGSVLPQREFPANLGIPGWSVFEAQQSLVPVEALRWPKSVRTYEDMRRDGQIQGLLASLYLPIRHMEWYVDPNGTTGTMAEEIAEDFGLPILGDETGDSEDGPGIVHDELLRLALLALALGHQFFEEAGEIEGSGDNMRYRLRTLAQRPPATISRINVAPSGDLISIKQIGTLPAPEIPAERMLAYVWDREGGNWAGRPLLYGLYRHWLLKDELIRGDAVMHRRFSGIPVTEQTVPGAVDQGSHDAAAEMAQRIRSGDTSGLSMPYGLKLRLLGVEGTLPDAIKSVEYHDKQMARAFMQMFAELGNTQHGSRALGITLVDHYALGVLAVAHWYRRTLMQLVKRIKERNYGAAGPVPKIGFRQDDHEDLTAEQLVALIDAGAIIVDDDLEATIRARANLPARNPNQEGRVPPTAQPPIVNPAAAAARDRRHRHPARAATGNPAAEALTDFAGLQAKYEEALAQLKATWTGVQAGQITQLVNQVEAAIGITELAAVTPDVEGAAALQAVLLEVLEHGAQSAVDEATAQGATLPAPDLTTAETKLTAATDAIAVLLARELGESAASKAIALANGGLSNPEIASAVREHLEGLAGATPEYEIAGLVSRAQNEGRFTAMEGAPAGTRFYASELNDTNTCVLCEHEDGTEFSSIADLRRDYPAGGFVGCEGGNRCRGTGVAVYAETPGQAS